MWEADKAFTQTEKMIDIITPNQVKDIWNTINSEFSTATHKNDNSKIPIRSYYNSVLESKNEPLKRYSSMHNLSIQANKNCR